MGSKSKPAGGHQAINTTAKIQSKGELELLFVIAGLGFAARVVYAVWLDNIIHPDEIMQYLEQAHRNVFGYGLIPWEYRHGVRSWLLPWMLSFILSFTKKVGLDNPAAYVTLVKLTMSALACTLIISTYTITSKCWPRLAGLTSAIATASWFELIIYSPRATPETLATYSFCAGLASLYNPKGSISHVLSGLTFGLCVCLRNQYLPVVIIALSLYIIRFRLIDFRSWCLGFMAILTLTLIIDALYWGSPIMPFVNNIRYNAVYGISSTFGTEGSFFYIGYAWLSSMLLFIYLLIACRPVAQLMMQSRKYFAETPSRFELSHMKQNRILLTAIIISILVLHSAVPHKEYRFVVIAIPLICSLAAGLANSCWISQVPRRIGFSVSYTLILSSAALVSILFVFMGHLSYSLTHAYNYYSRLVIRSPSLDVSKALRNISSAKAVLRLDASRGYSGGYYYLHRKIRMYGRVDSAELSPSDYNLYFSHIVQEASKAIPPGFRQLTIIRDDIVILERTPTPHDRNFIPLPGDINIMNPNVDGKHEGVR